eukprot:g11937.t1
MTSGFHHGHWGTLMPFLHACRRRGEPRRPLPAPERVPPSPELADPGLSLDSLGLAALAPHIGDWTQPLRQAWKFSEAEALRRLRSFIDDRLQYYEKSRSRADLQENPNSVLSPYLRWGQLSPQDVYWAVKDRTLSMELVKTFLRRLFWREPLLGDDLERSKEANGNW